MRLANALEHDHRYVVVVRGLIDDAGQPVPATRGSAALRDGKSTRLAGIEERRADESPRGEGDRHPGKPRKMPKIQDQGWHFLETGEVIGTCEGVCDPE